MKENHVRQKAGTQHRRPDAAENESTQSRQGPAAKGAPHEEGQEEGLKSPKTHPAVEAVQALAVECLTPDAIYGLATDTTTFSRPGGKKPPAHLLAIAITGVGSVVIAIDQSEWLAAMNTTMEECGASHAPKAAPRKSVDKRPNK